jgi:hypothetical protein
VYHGTKNRDMKVVQCRFLRFAAFKIYDGAFPVLVLSHFEERNLKKG